MAGKKRIDLRRERAAAKTLFLAGGLSMTDIAATFGVSPRTMSSWKKKDNWDDALDTEISVDDKIKTLIKESLVTALEEFKKNPTKTPLQSLVSILKQHQKSNEPAKELFDYMLKFIAYAIDYFEENDLPCNAQIIKEHAHDLSTYFKDKAHA